MDFWRWHESTQLLQGALLSADLPHMTGATDLLVTLRRVTRTSAVPWRLFPFVSAAIYAVEANSIECEQN